MSAHIFLSKKAILAGTIVPLLALGYMHPATPAGSSGSPAAPAVDHEYFKMDENGNLIQPEGYREWIYVGTPLTPNELNGGEAPFPEFHNVYIDPTSWKHYKDTGTFREGTVLVKELVSVGSKQAVSGNGYFMGEFLGLEATIKSKKLFPNEPGYWAYFSFGHSYPLAKTAKAFPAAACNACHENSAADDFVFTQYYPVLRAAKGDPNKHVHDGANCPKCMETVRRFDSARRSAEQPAAMVTATAVRSVPTEKVALFRWLQRGGYKSWTRERAKHPSRGPHTKFGRPVLSYFNPALERSLKAGQDSHPMGAAAVKEMYEPNGTLTGWAVAVKTQADSDGGRGWYWYEITSTTDGSKPVAAGNGIPLCYGCHSPGRDFVLTTNPFK